MFWKRKPSAPAGIPPEQVVRIVTNLYPAILDNRPDDFDTTLAASGVDARHRAYYVQLALATLDTMFSKDDDKQSHGGMVAALVAKDIDAELASSLLRAASETLLRRDKAR
jgi:hypothetical protein